jgi:hypothetical protein
MTAEESNRFLVFLDNVRASLDDPDEQFVHQIFETPKRLITEIDNLFKSGELNLAVAEERRFRIQAIAWSTAYTRVLNCWNTRDRLDEEFARYHRIVSGREQQHPKGKEDMRRTEALRQFEDVRRLLQNGGTC